MLKRTLMFVVVLFTAAVVARAEDNAPITNSGASNFMFSFGGLGNLAAGPFLTQAAGGTSSNLIPTYGVGYRYFISNDMAIRATLGLVLNNTTNKGNPGFSDGTNNQTAFGIGAGVQWHMHPMASISPYAGAEIGFLTGSTKSTPSVASGNSAPVTTYSGTDLGISVHAGAEWFFNSAMSFAAEYKFGFTTSSSTTTFQPPTGSSTSTDGPSLTSIGTNAVSVILNVYIGK